MVIFFQGVVHNRVDDWKMQIIKSLQDEEQISSHSCRHLVELRFAFFQGNFSKSEWTTNK